ncbi:hypothetical protein JXA40_07060 [bacterium]|nr:hypothetical protein [candidate division CSSED10-310 bacterium]
MNIPRIFAAAAIMMVVATVIGAVALIGSPEKQRRIRLDEERVQDLQSIARAVDAYWSRHDALPDDLETLRVEPDLQITVQDPVTRKQYGYRTTGEASFELCAEFSREVKMDSISQHYNRFRGGIWAHPAGSHCFKLQVQINKQ